MKFLSLIFLAACTAGAETVPASTLTTPAAPAPTSWSYSLTPSFVSQYMFRGQLLGGASFQPAVEADYGNLALGMWVSTPLANKVDGQSDPEIDPYGSYKIAVNDSLSLSPGFQVYTYPRAPTSQGFYRATFEPSLALSYVFNALTLTPKIYYDVVLKGATYEFNAAYAYQVPALNTEFDFTGTVGTFSLDAATNSSPTTKSSGNYWLIGVGVPYTLKNGSKLTLGFAYTEGWSSAGTVGRGVLSLSYVFNF